MCWCLCWADTFVACDLHWRPVSPFTSKTGGLWVGEDLVLIITAYCTGGCCAYLARGSANKVRNWDVVVGKVSSTYKVRFASGQICFRPDLLQAGSLDWPCCSWLMR